MISSEINNHLEATNNNESTKMSNKELNLTDLPNDVLLLIMKKLNYKDLIVTSQVNKRLYNIANDNLLWKLKLINDINKWKIINSSNLPVEYFLKEDTIDSVSYKDFYLHTCPDVLTQIEILNKLKSVKSTMESNKENNEKKNQNPLSTLLSSFPVLNNIKDYIYNNLVNNVNMMASNSVSDDLLPKIIMFGPGLETTTSCLVTNLLWKSEFKTVGMIPGRDGYGSGLKLKLLNHDPFNLTILYTNVSQIRQNQNVNHNLEKNKLLVRKANTDNSDSVEYEINPQVKDACSNACAFIYVIDNNCLADVFSNDSNLTASASTVENYKQELNALMNESPKDLPLLILSCRTDSANSTTTNKGLSCAEIIDKFALYELKHEWQIRDCQIFQNQMKDIALGFDWILNKINKTKQ